MKKFCAILFSFVLVLVIALPVAAEGESSTLADNAPSLTAPAAYVVNLDTNIVVYEKNSETPLSAASLTKMMTALLFLESGKDMNAEITIPASLTQEFKDIQNANGSTMNLRIGETVRRIDLLYGLLVASANDAASVIASDVSDGDLTAFVARMNQRAKELGCTSTSFTCVHGLYD